MSLLMFNDIKDIRDKNDNNYWSSIVNLPKTDEYITNNRGQRLHVRSYWPNSSTCKSLVIFCHGYASHINRPLHSYISKQYNDNDIGYVTIDVSGHGYSDGVKGYIDSYNDTIDDILSLLICLYSTSSTSSNLQRKELGLLPFFFMGHSMGGAISINIASILCNLNDYYNVSHTSFRLFIIHYYYYY